MKLADALVALQLVPADPDRAITAAEFASKWRRAGQREVSTRQLHRWLPDLEMLNLVVVTRVRSGSRRYHLSRRASVWCQGCAGSATATTGQVIRASPAKTAGWVPAGTCSTQPEAMACA
jgi:hypothetical protein